MEEAEKTFYHERGILVGKRECKTLEHGGGEQLQENVQQRLEVRLMQDSVLQERQSKMDTVQVQSPSLYCLDSFGNVFSVP